MADHLDLEKLVAYLLGDLPAAEGEAVEEHFFACARCAGRLEWLAALSDGVRAVVRDGRVGLYISRGFVDALAKAGLRLRHYQLELNGSVNCTIRADDDAVVSRLRAPLAGVTRVDVVRQMSIGGVEEPEDRIRDVPFSAAAGEVVFIPNPSWLKATASFTMRSRLVAVDEKGERTLGEYTFVHAASA